MLSNKNSFLKVELLQQYDIINQVYIEDRNLKLDMNAIQNGVFKQIGASESIILLTIASFTDIEGCSFPSQRKLAELTGFSLPTVNKLVNKLLVTEINGVPLLSREFEQSGGRRKHSVYRVNAQKKSNEESELKVILQNGITEETPKNSKDVAMIFKHIYEEEYGIPYTINFRREVSMIKNKLIPNYTVQQLIKMFEYIVKNYKEKWANTRYPYPTISMVCSWLGNTAIQMMKSDEEKQKETELLEKMTEKYLEADYSDFESI